MAVLKTTNMENNAVDQPMKGLTYSESAVNVVKKNEKVESL